MQKVENQFYFCTTECGVLILWCQQGSVGLYLVFWLKSIWEPQIRFHGHDHGNLARKHSMYPLQQSTSNNGYIHKPRLKYGFGNGGFKLYLVLWLFYIKQCHKTPYNQKLPNAFSDKLRQIDENLCKIFEILLLINIKRNQTGKAAILFIYIFPENICGWTSLAFNLAKQPK